MFHLGFRGFAGTAGFQSRGASGALVPGTCEGGLNCPFLRNNARHRFIFAHGARHGGLGSRRIHRELRRAFDAIVSAGKYCAGSQHGESSQREEEGILGLHDSLFVNLRFLIFYGHAVTDGNTPETGESLKKPVPRQIDQTDQPA
jgi:hypothetical protein